jgi:hypothetical protein
MEITEIHLTICMYLKRKPDIEFQIPTKYNKSIPPNTYTQYEPKHTARTKNKYGIYTMKRFTIPKRCTIKSVNSALETSGFTDISIYYDVSNDGRITISHECTDSYGGVYNMDQRTSAENAREWAERFAAGEWFRHY